jgi:hypothetical protein
MDVFSPDAGKYSSDLFFFKNTDLVSDGFEGDDLTVTNQHSQ